ncbi:MarR family winged helix-turn-helix transcriptional regulator [Clostridium aminobutyricum]|uniref:MarR family transcriptional regulator n=1 Tax=Clostridium aminobutyricum TaxID=33953 RepID=A0A939IIZ8_CLOAM|nr:MarR family transcriptional regulator [Clostridium aminobutyricum]MBN7773591.1 MarR family transcriptional regulator [Clostridium aminobutyricum]
MHQNEDIGFLVKIITECIDKMANQHLKQFDLTLSQGRILQYLRERIGEKTSQKDIENYFDVTHPTVIGILNRLERKGFIRSEFDSADKRVKNIYLIPEKEISVYYAMGDFKKIVDQKLSQGLTDVQMKELQSLLKMILNNLQD